jgi:hypothetical protein
MGWEYYNRQISQSQCDIQHSICAIIRKGLRCYTTSSYTDVCVQTACLLVCDAVQSPRSHQHTSAIFRVGPPPPPILSNYIRYHPASINHSPNHFEPGNESCVVHRNFGIDLQQYAMSKYARQ